MQSNNPSPQSSYSDNKSTRKYVKTGKYSKKKQQQTQQQLQVTIQQQIQAALQQNPQSLAAQQLLQQAVAMANLHNSNNNNNSNNNESLGTSIPPFSSQQLTNISTSMHPITSQQQLSATDSPSASTTPTTTISSSPSTPFNTMTNVHPVQSINSTTANTLEMQLINMPLPISVSGVSNNNNSNNSITQKNATLSSMAVTGGLPSSINSHLDKLVRNNVSNINKNVEQQHIEIIKRCTESLQNDHEKITKPDYLTPFKSLEDAMDRLLPYHIYQYPLNDLDANKIPMDRQDHTMLDIYKSQVDIFKRYNKVIKKKLKSKKNLENQIMLERQVMSSIRQRVNEEQMRVQMEQKAQQQALRLQAEAEKARLLQQQQLHQQQLHQQQLQQQQLQQQQLQQQQLQHQQFLQGQQPNTNSAMQNFPYEAYAQTLHALMQNKEFAEQYQKLTPELQQQFLRNLNHEKVAEFLKRKNNMSTG
ncbi:hypothetical protein BJ944DRAFT_240363 [Cunninghamella echinulata]|nr:hypothetical protein BJ944DRAFT_240363 [Cunninghamella echinulata]